MKKNRIIVHITSEVVPFYKRGGLGDVVGALPQYLENEQTHNIVISPFYEGKMKHLDRCHYENHTILYQGILYSFTACSLNMNQVEYYFIKLSDSEILNPEENNDGSRAYSAPANLVPYFYFAKGALQLVIDNKLSPDYLFCHDWHTGGCFGFTGLLEQIKKHKDFTTLFIIHNYDFQGIVYEDIYEFLDAEVILQLKEIFSQYRSASLLALALKNSDYTATVSHSYARELVENRVPHTGLKHLGLCNSQVLSFLNGSDYSCWKPGNSPYLPFSYNAGMLEKKREIKKIVQQRCGFGDPGNTEPPMVLMLCRLTAQKGIHLFTQNHGSDAGCVKQMADFLEQGTRFIICGNPGGGVNGVIDNRLSYLQEKFPGRFFYLNRYSEELAHTLLAAADILLAPSLFEPCGLIQVYAMAFGTLPVVHPVGGMKDTVCCCFENPGKATGFYLDNLSQECLRDTMKKVIHLYYHEPRQWEEMINRAMKVDFSWQKMKDQYLRFFDVLECDSLISFDRLSQIIKSTTAGGPYQ